jgi:hypothetical protein
MQIEELIEYYPRLYHMAADGSWPCIRQRGLRSTASLVDLFQVPEPRRTELLTQHRAGCVPLLHPRYGHAVIRDQKPLQVAKLEQLLTDMTVAEWIRLLNSHVFFWLHPGRLATLLNARAYRRRPHLVLTVDTRSLITAHLERIRLSRLNSGATTYMNGLRGSATFQRIPDFQHPRSRLRPSRSIAELAVEEGVPDIVDHTVEVERRQGDRVLETISSR